MRLSIGARAALTLIVALLCSILGLTAANSGQQVIYKNVPAAAASSHEHVSAPKQVTPTISMPKQFAVASTRVTNSGYKLTTYSCAPGLNSVDVLPGGKSVTYGDTKESLVEDDDQSGKTLNITLGSTTALPGIIVHLFTTSDDSVNPDGLSDKIKLVQLLPGQHVQYDLRYSDFVRWNYLDGVASVTLCFN